MKILQQYSRQNYGVTLHTVQLEVPASKRIIRFDGNLNLYLSLPKIGIIASFFCSDEARTNISRYLQYGFFIDKENKTYPILLPNVSRFLIDSCSSEMNVEDHLSLVPQGNYAETIFNCFFKSAFAIGSGSVEGRLRNYLLETEGYRDLQSQRNLLYKKWEDKTKTIKDYDLLVDQRELIELIKILEIYDLNCRFDEGPNQHQFHILSREYVSQFSKTLKNNSTIADLEPKKGLRSLFSRKINHDFFREIVEEQRNLFISQMECWGS